MFQLLSHLTQHLATCGQFCDPFACTDTYLNSFLPSTINLWNSLPESLLNLDIMINTRFIPVLLPNRLTLHIANDLCFYTVFLSFTW